MVGIFHTRPKVVYAILIGNTFEVIRKDSILRQKVGSKAHVHFGKEANASNVVLDKAKNIIIFDVIKASEGHVDMSINDIVHYVS